MEDEVERTEELSEEVKEALEDIMKNPEKYPTEARFILVQTIWVRPGQAFDDSRRMKVLDGDVLVITIDEGYNYPHQDWETLAIIPKTCPTVLKFEHYWDYGLQNSGYEIEYYIFTKQGWKHIKPFDDKF